MVLMEPRWMVFTSRTIICPISPVIMHSAPLRFDSMYSGALSGPTACTKIETATTAGEGVDQSVCHCVAVE